MSEEKPRCVQVNDERSLMLKKSFSLLIQNFAALTQTTEDEMIGLCADIIFRIHCSSSSPEYTDKCMTDYLTATLENYRMAWETEQAKTGVKN